MEAYFCNAKDDLTLSPISFFVIEHVPTSFPAFFSFEVVRAFFFGLSSNSSSSSMLDEVRLEIEPVLEWSRGCEARLRNPSRADRAKGGVN